MTTHEWACLILVLLGGFWRLNRSLTKIEVALSGKVGFKDCADRQEKCPCRKALEEIQERMERLHPHQK